MQRTNEFANYSSGQLFAASIGKLFEKKTVRVILSALAAAAALVILNFTVVYFTASAALWASYLFNLPVFILFMAGGGGFFSNLGTFSVKKFNIISAAVGTTLAISTAVYITIAGAVLPLDFQLCLRGVGLTLLRSLPVSIISMILILIPQFISKKIYLRKL